MARTTAITLPNGDVAIRTSRTRVYEWAVIKTTDNREKAERLRAEADAAQARYDRIMAIVESDDMSQFERRVVAANGRGDKFYATYLPGDPTELGLPDHATDAWARYADGALTHLRERPALLRDQAETLDAGPEDSYEVVRWSSRRDLADKALGEFWLAPEQRLFVHPCYEVVKPVKARGANK